MMTPSRPGLLKRTMSAMRRFGPKYLYALAVTPFLFTLGVFFRNHRFLIFQIARHFGLKMPEVERKIPVISLSHVLEQHLDLILLEPLVEGGNVSLLELLVISTLTRRADPPLAFEIGTFDGRTTLNIAANLPSQGKVYTLDLPCSDLRDTRFELAPGESAFVDKRVSGSRFIQTEFAFRIEQLFGDSATFDFSPYHRRNGLVFVDGSHAFNYVRQDTETALHLAANENAIILWHDYQPDWPGVIKALNQLYQTNPALSGLRLIEGTSLVILKRENSSRPA